MPCLIHRTQRFSTIAEKLKIMKEVGFPHREMNLRKCKPSLGRMVGNILTIGNDEFYFTPEL